MNTTLENRQVNSHELELKVKDMYKKVALNPEEKYHFEMGRGLAEHLGYPTAELDNIPAKAIESFAGVGYYFDLAKLKKGEKVVDLGSGSGMDVFYAANQVGKSGEIFGIDMTKEQLEKSIFLKKEFGFSQVNFLESYIEELPILSESMDAVISNGVINLSSEKNKVFQETARVLKPGGRLVLSDIVSTKKLPETISCNATLWAACIGGAMQVDEYLDLIEANRLEIVGYKDNPYAFISNGAKGATDDYGIKSISVVAIKK